LLPIPTSATCESACWYFRRPAAVFHTLRKLLPQTRSGSARALVITMARAVRAIVVPTCNAKAYRCGNHTYLTSDPMLVTTLLGMRTSQIFRLSIYKVVRYCKSKKRPLQFSPMQIPFIILTILSKIASRPKSGCSIEGKPSRKS